MSSQSVFLWAAGAAVLAVTACTGTLVTPGNTGGTTTTTDTGVAGDPPYTTTYTFSQSTTSYSYTTTTQDCAPWGDWTGQGSATIHFVNQTAQTLYLPALCDGRPSFSLTTGNGPNAIYDTSCLQTCQDLQTEPPYACGVCAPSAIRLDPGGSRDFVWDGTDLEPGFMPSACFLVPTNTLCSQKKGANPGNYTVAGAAYPACDGSCSCGAGGLCSGTASGQPVQATATLDFPSAGYVEVDFTDGAIPDGGLADGG